MFHFVLIAGGNAIEPAASALAKKAHINRNALPYRCFQIFRTSLLVCVGELFFRANGLRAGLTMFQKIFTGFSLSSLKSGVLFTYGMDVQDYCILLVTLLIIFAVGLLQEKGVAIRERLSKSHVVIRFAAAYGLILFIVIFGAYGIGYLPVDPIYAAF